MPKTVLQMLFVVAAVVICCGIVIAQGSSSPDIWTFLTNPLVLIIEVATVGGIIYNAVTFSSRKNYDKLKENNDLLNEFLKTKEKQIEHLEEKYNREVKILELEVKRLGINNEAVTSINMQMKAILKNLRLSGDWEGHEDEIFRHK